MKSALTYGTASVALIASLMGPAHATESNETDMIGPVVELVEKDADPTEVPAHLDKRDNAAGSPALVAMPAVSQSTATLPVLSPVTVPTAMFDRVAPLENGLANVTIPSAATMVAEQGLEETVTLRSVDPLYGDIDPFYGTINPFYGNIDAFWGTINPFWGTINPFYGDIDPFYGDISPFYGDISAFWGDINPFYGDIVAFEGELSSISNFGQQLNTQIAATETNWSSLNYTIASDGSVDMSWDGVPNMVHNELNTLINQAEAQFGAAYTAKTGKNFRDGFVAEILAEHGIDMTSKESLAKTAGERAAFYLDWNDGLMMYSGVDLVDHWMPMINWTPSITQIQGSGADTIIGIIDGSFADDTDLSDNVIYSGGHFNRVGGHGAGVASLIAGAHDGEGVMGIAPNVNIATYNPFNHQGKTGWGIVADGVLELQNLNQGGHNQTGKASIINMSLGQKGWVFSQGMATLMSRVDIAAGYNDTVYVIAAGNDGVTQTQNVQWGMDPQWVWDKREWEWEWTDDASMIFVGAVDTTGEIAGFSNRPGNACILRNGQCYAGNELYMRTVVAPGLMLAMSDGEGGVMRASGTSFAAPLVSGAIALLHDRWEWLAHHPEASTEIIFRSARDLGAPGPDQVYGWGLLDVAASQSPLDFNALSFKLYKKGLFGTLLPQHMSATSVLNMGIPSWWETSDVYFTAFENVGDTHRDFAIPASTFATGNSTNALGRGYERFQDFINKRFANWINSGGSDSNGDGLPGFTELRSNDTKLSGEWALRYDAVAPQYTQDGEMRMVHGAATLTEPSGKASFTLGHGQGAMALTGYQFGVMSDYDPYTGGANPVLGLASGEAFMQLGYQLTGNTKVSVGYSENREEWDEVGQIDPLDLQARQQLGDRPATAFTFDLEQRVTDNVTVGAQYTRLEEVNALLGTQTATAALLGSGSHTDALTLSASINVGSGVTFDVSATGGRTETSRDQLFTSSGSVLSSAGQFTATKRGIFNGKDTLRVSVAQPLQVEQGSLQVVTDEVTNRETGARGPVTQTFSIETERRITGEAVYALPLTNSSEFSAFSRYVSAGETFDEAGFVVGGNFSIRF